MRICVVDGSKIGDRAQLHEVLADSLGFPDWYGGNLDALYDCLTDVREETQIQLLHRDVLAKRLGNYAEVLEKVLHAAAADNPNVRWTAEEQKS